MDSGKRKKQVYQQLGVMGEATTHEMGWTLKLGSVCVRRYLGELEAEGKIRRVGTGKNRVVVWRCVE